MNTIVKTCNKIFEKYNVEYCYLFGSYTKNIANEKSDIDLLISSTISGLDFYGLVENLKQSLKKRSDLITINQVYVACSNIIKAVSQAYKMNVYSKKRIIYGKQK